MRFFTLILMIAVAVTGGLFSYRLVTGRDLVSLGGLGLVPQAQIVTPTALPSPTPTRQPEPTAQPTPTPSPTQTPEPKFMVVANTDGQGVYLRRSPQNADRIKPWVEGSRMEVTGPAVDGEGGKWVPVRAPDGTAGFVPERYLKEP